MTRLTNIDIAAVVERAVDALAAEKERRSAPQATLLVLGRALARDYRTAPADLPTTRSFYTKDRLRLAFPAVGATAPSEKSFHATPDQLGRWLQGRRHRDHVAGEPVEVQLVGPTAPQRGDGGIGRHLYLHVAITAATTGSVLHDSRATPTRFTPAELAPYHPQVATINEIPAPLPDFVGRDFEFNDIVSWLSGSEASAPTFILHGPPGSGKTELAIRAAHALSEQFSIRLLIDGRGLDPVPPSSATLLRTILRRCGQNPKDDGAAVMDLVTALVRAIGERRALIVLDNTHDSNQVAELRMPAGSALLMTAREPIAYPGARIHDIGALDRESARGFLIAASGQASSPIPATWRRRRIDGIDPRDIAVQSTTVADLLAQLCGFAPIALRAAANLLRLGEYAPLALAERMFDERHRLDSIGSVGIRAPIAAILSVAYGRLSTRGARAVRALATFPANFDRAVARALEVDTATLDELLDRGFVQRRGDDRLLLHDLYRLYARTRAEADEPAAFALARMMHAAYVINMAAHVAKLWREGDPTANTALSAMDAEWPNFDAAHAWAITYAERTGDAVALEELVLNLRWLLVHLRDAETLLAWSQKAHDIAIAQSRWVDASRHLVSIAIAHYLRGDSAAEQEAQERGLALAERVNDEDLIRAHAANVAVSLEYAGRLSEALALLERVVALDAKAEAWRGELSDQVSLALVALRLRDFRKAEAAAQRAAEFAREHGQQQELGNALGILGNIYAEEEEWQHALDYYDAALDAFEASRYHAGEIVVRASIGRVHVMRGDKRGIDEIDEAIRAAKSKHDHRGELHGLIALGRTYEHLRDWASAAKAYDAALPIAEALQDRPREELIRERQQHLLPGQVTSR
ncbi:MAG TPA: AAA family ATPase [Thermoanaerobaculia bacterium]|nr:AAA family ATPase [Thermoanaerobaculia bacterium]